MRSEHDAAAEVKSPLAEVPLEALAARRAAWWLAVMPALFVVIWSTGFVVARLGMPHAPPLSFLSIRFALSAACLLGWALCAGTKWPQGRAQWFHLAALGALMHAGYLGAGWAAVKQGLGAGTMSLIAGLQPVLTAVYLSLRPAQARLNRLQWAGLCLGTFGLVLVVWRKLGLGEAGVVNLSLGFSALLFITIAALYQQRFVRQCDSRTALCVKMVAACLVTAPLGLLEREALDWGLSLCVALGWSVLGLTLGGSSLLYLMLQRGAATRVTSLMYLVPPCAAVMSWLLFGEQLGVSVWMGMALSAIGVYLVIRR